jgi:carbonic anhydrase/acetyltransferase-like protein (isoleucine patch superfamily)
MSNAWTRLFRQRDRIDFWILGLLALAVAGLVVTLSNRWRPIGVLLVAGALLALAARFTSKRTLRSATLVALLVIGLLLSVRGRNATDVDFADQVARVRQEIAAGNAAVACATAMGNGDRLCSESTLGALGAIDPLVPIAVTTTTVAIDTVATTEAPEPGGSPAEVGLHTSIDPTAIIDPTATVGDRSRVGPDVRVLAGVTIGDDVQIRRGASIGEGAIVGDRVVIGTNRVIPTGATIDEGSELGDVAVSGAADVAAPPAACASPAPDGAACRLEDAHRLLLYASARLADPSPDDVPADVLLAEAKVAARQALLIVMRVETDRFAKDAIPQHLVETATAQAKAVDAALTDLGRTQDGSQDDTRAFVVRGADAAVTDVLDPENPAGVNLGVYGWIAVVAGLLLLYRWLEVTNNYRSAAPITVKTAIVGDGADTKGDQIAAQLKGVVAKADVDAPALLPAGAKVEGLIDLVQHDTIPGGKTLGSALKAVWWTAFPPGGITVQPIVTKRDVPGVNGAKASAVHSVEISVATTRRGKPLYTDRYEDEDLRTAVAKAGYRVGAEALEFSRLVPSWTRWGNNGGEALRLYDRATSRNELDRAGDKSALELLQRAHAIAPSNAQVRVAMGHEHDIAGERLKALRRHLEASLAHRRFLEARYRVITSLSMLADDIDNQWLGPARTIDRDACVDLLVASGTLARAPKLYLDENSPLIGLTVCSTSSPAEPSRDLEAVLRRESAHGADAKHLITLALLHLAVVELDHLRGTTKRRWRLWYSVRQTERAYWFRTLRQRNNAARKDRDRSLRLIIELRRILLSPPPLEPRVLTAHNRALIKKLEDDVTKLVSPSGVDATTLYNAACFWSLTAASHKEDTELTQQSCTHRSVDLLRRATIAPRGALPGPAWLRKDPDLKAVRDDPAFIALLDDLERAGDEKEK